MDLFTFLMLCCFCCNCTALRTISPSNSPLPFIKGYVFPKPAWIENIAVRPTGDLLLTRLDCPELYLLDFESHDPHPVLVYRFPNKQALTGIVELAPDVFAISVGNYTLASGPTTGSWTVYRLELLDRSTTSSNETLKRPAYRMSRIAHIPEAAYVKGMSRLSEQYILLSDFRAGVVYRLDINTGAYTIVIENSLTAAVPQPIFGASGINDIQVHDDYLYFTNTGQNIFARIPIRADGTPAGDASIVAHTPASSDYFDGFTFGASGAAYLGTGSGNTLVRLSPSGGPVVKIGGSINSTLLPEPTNCAFGRGIYQRMLYVTTAGSQAAPVQGSYSRGGSVWLSISRRCLSECVPREVLHVCVR